MKESFSLVEKIFTSEQRATEVVEKAIERIPAYGWKGRALSEGGAINSFLHNLIGNRLPSLIRRLKQYKDEKGKGFFAGKEKALDSVLTDLMLAYTWNLGQQYDNPEAFRGKKPLEWQQNYWKLAQAMACSYPNNANPCVQILECANSDHEGGKIFEKCLKVGENGGEPFVQSVQPIEPGKLRLLIKGFPEELSFRQALGQLVAWKGMRR